MWARIALPVFVGTGSLVGHACRREAYARIEANITIGYGATCAFTARTNFVRKARDMR